MFRIPFGSRAVLLDPVKMSRYGSNLACNRLQSHEVQCKKCFSFYLNMLKNDDHTVTEFCLSDWYPEPDLNPDYSGNPEPVKKGLGASTLILICNIITKVPSPCSRISGLDPAGPLFAFDVPYPFNFLNIRYRLLLIFRQHHS